MDSKQYIQYHHQQQQQQPPTTQHKQPLQAVERLWHAKINELATFHKIDDRVNVPPATKAKLLETKIAVAVKTIETDRQTDGQTTIMPRKPVVAKPVFIGQLLGCNIPLYQNNI